MSPGELFDSVEAAAYLGVKRTTFWKLAGLTDGEGRFLLPAVRLTLHNPRWRKVVLDAFIKMREVLSTQGLKKLADGRRAENKKRAVLPEKHTATRGGARRSEIRSDSGRAFGTSATAAAAAAPRAPLRTSP